MPKWLKFTIGMLSTSMAPVILLAACGGFFYLALFVMALGESRGMISLISIPFGIFGGIILLVWTGRIGEKFHEFYPKPSSIS